MAAEGGTHCILNTGWLLGEEERRSGEISNVRDLKFILRREKT